MNGFGGNKKMLWSRRINRRMGCLLADVRTAFLVQWESKNVHQDTL